MEPLDTVSNIKDEALIKYFESELNQVSRANFHFQVIQGKEKQSNDTKGVTPQEKANPGFWIFHRTSDRVSVKSQWHKKKKRKKKRNKRKGNRTTTLKKGLRAKFDVWILFGS